MAIYEAPREIISGLKKDLVELKSCRTKGLMLRSRRRTSIQRAGNGRRRCAGEKSARNGRFRSHQSGLSLSILHGHGPRRIK